MCLALLGVLSGANKSADQLYREAQRAERAGDLSKAYLLYAAAAVQDPSNQLAWYHAQALRPIPPAGEPSPSPGAPSSADPDIAGSISDQDLAESRRLLPPPQLQGRPGQKDFDLRGDSPKLFEQVASAFGLEPVLDSGYQPKTGVRLNLTESDFRDALLALEAATDSFVIPLTARRFLVANDTTQKRAELDRTVAIVLPVPEPFAIQEVQEIATAVRGALDIQRLMVDNQRRLILIRDRVSKVRLAQKLIDDLMQPKPQVAVEVEILTTDESSSLTYGLSLPSKFQLVWFGKGASLSTIFPAGFANFLGFGGGKSFLGLGVTDGSLFLNATKSSSRTLLRSEVVTSDGQAATLHIGDKYPIQTNGYFGGQPTGGGQVFTPPPSFNFEDLGLLLKITPHVHGTDEMTLEVESEFKLLGSQAVDGIPIISNRKFQSKVRVGTGEWAVIAGLMTDSDATTISGIAGLSVVPVLRKNDHNRSHGETLIVLKPHLLSMPPTEQVIKAAWVGTETRPRPIL